MRAKRTPKSAGDGSKRSTHRRSSAAARSLARLAQSPRVSESQRQQIRAMLEEPVRQLELDLAFVANALRGKDTEEGLSRLLRFSRKLPLILCALEPSAARILGQTSAAAVMAVAFAA